MNSLKLVLLLTGLTFMSNIQAAQNTETALEFINSLTVDQKERVTNSFDDSRANWHYLPISMFDRKGVPMHDLNENQGGLLHKLLQSYLSQKGYDKTKNIISLEKVLQELGGSPDYRDPDLYHVAFYGNPDKDKVWGWKFEGHHISLNFTVADEQISYAPRFFGANPAEVPSGSQKGLRALKEEEDIALKLMASLNKDQREKTIFKKSAYSDILSGNDSEVVPFDKEGISVKELNTDQNSLLKKLIMEYLSAMPDDLANKRMQQVEQSNFNEITFGWAGVVALHEPHYYRIQGDTFLIELDNTQNNANHIHCVWRDFEGDFGRDIIKEHYKNSNHHDN